MCIILVLCILCPQNTIISQVTENFVTLVSIGYWTKLSICQFYQFAYNVVEIVYMISSCIVVLHMKMLKILLSTVIVLKSISKDDRYFNRENFQLNRFQNNLLLNSHIREQFNVTAAIIMATKYCHQIISNNYDNDLFWAKHPCHTIRRLSSNKWNTFWGNIRHHPHMLPNLIFNTS